MIKMIQKMIGDKKEYKEQLVRAEQLPEAYRFVFEKMQAYMWQFAGGDGSDMIKVQGEILTLFEMSVVDGKHVLEVTGEDVAAFCDEWLRDTRKWTDYYRDKLNRKMSSPKSGQ
ncbi:MAG: DUF1048 domain-containing protein [Cellulosilyticaceae bacterium]